MKKLNKTISAVFFAALTSLGMAREQGPGFYIAGLVSADFTSETAYLETEQENGRSGALALGYYTRGPIRFEAEFGTHTFDNGRFFSPAILTVPGYRGEDNGKSKHLSLMANVFYDFPINRRLDFNLGAGVGVMRFSGAVPKGGPTILIFPPPPQTQYSGIDRLAAQVLAGLSFHITPRFALTGGYRLAAAKSASYRGVYSINTGEFHSVELGMRIKL